MVINWKCLLGGLHHLSSIFIGSHYHKSIRLAREFSPILRQLIPHEEWVGIFLLDLKHSGEEILKLPPLPP